MPEAVSLDPIALEINWNGLKSIADECFLTIMRSAFSTNMTTTCLGWLCTQMA